MVLINTQDALRRPALEIPESIEPVEQPSTWFSLYVFGVDWQHLNDYDSFYECVVAAKQYNFYKVLRCRMVDQGIISEILI